LPSNGKYKVGLIAIFTQRFSYSKKLSRCFEFLGATNASTVTPIPGKTSFTSALIWALKEFAEKDPPQKFTTTELASKIQEAPHFPRDQEISLRSRNLLSTQRIVLSPLQEDGLQNQVTEDPIRKSPECLELRLYFDPGPQDNDLYELAMALTRHIKDSQGSHHGVLYRVSVGRIYSLAHNAALKWLEHKRSGHLRQSPSVTVITTNQPSSHLALPATEIGRHNQTGSFRRTVEADNYQTTVQANDLEGLGNEQGVQFSIIDLVKMLTCAIWAAITEILGFINSQPGRHLRLS
jgi:hypothetical protein